MRVWQPLAAATALAMALGGGCSKDDDENPVKPPTLNELTRTWRVVRESSTLNFSSVTNNADIDASLLEITSQFIVTFSAGLTDTCFCPESIAYRVSGSSIVITDTVADRMFQETFGAYSMTWSNAGANLVITINATGTANSQFPQGTRFVMTLSYEPYTGPFPPPQCAVCGFTGIAKNLVMTSADRETGLLGRWRLIGSRVTASGVVTEDTSYSNITELYTFYADSAGPTTVSVLTYDISDNPSCYTATSAPYGLHGSALTGPLFEGGDTSDSLSTYTYSTTVSVSGGMLILTQTVRMSEQDEEGSTQATQTVTTYLAPYDGAVPPAEWPQTPCRGIFKARRLTVPSLPQVFALPATRTGR